MTPEVHIPEVIEPDEKLPADLVALRKFAILMDEALPVPGTGRRIGLDAGLGLIPGVGDIISAILSAWIIAGALRHRVPVPHILRMIFYVVLDLIVGEVPILGDIFDFAFEENVINMNALLRYRDRRRPPRSIGEIAGAALVVFGIILLAAMILLTAVVLAAVWLIQHR